VIAGDGGRCMVGQMVKIVGWTAGHAVQVYNLAE